MPKLLDEEIEDYILGLNEQMHAAKTSAGLWDPDAFEHELVFINHYVAQAERFSARLVRKHRHTDAQRLNTKIGALKDYCEAVRQRYE